MSKKYMVGANFFDLIIMLNRKPELCYSTIFAH